VPFAAATGPQQTRGRVTDDVIDGPAIAEWPLDRPALPVTAAGYQEGTLRRSDKYRDPILVHRLSPALGPRAVLHALKL
jgi:hypothetical protein